MVNVKTNFDYGKNAHLLVISGFGRKAAIDFLERAEKRERETIIDSTDCGDFFDEYRRTSISLHENLRYFKKDVLEPFISSKTKLDKSVMVGFSGGLDVSDVAPEIGRTVLEGCAFPLKNGVDQIVIAVPCNTLSPLTDMLEKYFASEKRIEKLARETDPLFSQEVLNAIIGPLLETDLEFPSVAEAVVNAADGDNFGHILPLGTENIAEIYEDAAEKTGSHAKILSAPEELKCMVQRAIRSCIEGDESAIAKSRLEVQKKASEVSRRHKEPVMVVEACTDLDLDIGSDSLEIYADYVIDSIYDGDEDYGCL